MKKHLELSAVVLAVLVFLLSAMIVSCGKKGNPVPRQQIKLQMIKNLRGEITEEGVLLSWTLPEKAKSNKMVKILRSVTIPGEDCPGCPQKFVLLTEKDEAYLQSGMKDPGQYRYLDRDIDTGRNYGYRVVWCISSGTCSPESNTAEIRFK
ncbi:MAG: hypothetical protein WCW53_10415 [Syntrophales bacterium]